ncbi:RTA1 like protein-domain-containing protein [Panaeolus papilionaceus]|nr:RTA1 like protein-domain-containing protein [Panaeolus papilionaceus]
MPNHNFHGSPYHYVPTEGVAITFIVLFGLSGLIHVAQAISYRMWWLIPTAGLCGLLEVMGWSARLWSSFSPSLSSPFEMQITATILGPTPLLAANFVIFGIIIQRLGPQFSRLSPKWYTIVFCTCDVISLVVQGVGGGKAAVAAGNDMDPTPGGHIMLGGICFQLLTITVYAVCACEYLFRLSRNMPIPGRQIKFNAQPMTSRMLLMIAGLVFSTLCLLIRAVYRTIELSNGWNGRIISTQVFFNVLDGAMVTLAFYSLNIAHPGPLLGRASKLNDTSDHDAEKRSNGSSA